MAKVESLQQNMSDTMFNEILRYCIQPMVYSKNVRKILIFNIIVGLVIIDINIGYFLYTFDGYILIMYSPAFILCFHGALALCMSAFCRKKFKKLFREKQRVFWPISKHSSKSTRNIINFEVNVVTLIFRCSMVCATLIAILLLRFLMDTCSSFYLTCKLSYMYIENMYINYIIICLEAQFIIFSIYLAMSTYILMYFLITLRFQLYLLHCELKRVFDLTDQNEIYFALIVVVKQHMKLKEYSKLVQNLSMYFALTYGVTGVINNFVYLTIIILGKIVVTTAFLVLLAFIVNLMACLYIHSGQAIENNFEEIFLICRQAPWYKWDPRTKNVFRIFLANATHNTKVYITRDLSMNYLIGIQTFKAVFTVANVLYSIASKQ